MDSKLYDSILNICCNHLERCIDVNDANTIERDEFLWRSFTHHRIDLAVAENEQLNYAFCERSTSEQIYKHSQYMLVVERLGKELKGLDIKHAFIKGPAISEFLYPKPHLRKYNDVDVLISKNSLGKVKEVLNELDFKQGEHMQAETGAMFVPYTRQEILHSELYTHETKPFQKILSSGLVLEVDINFNISWSGPESLNNSAGTNTSILLEHTHEHVCSNGNQITILEPEAAMLHSIAHFYSEATMFLYDEEEWLNEPKDLLLYRFLDLALLYEKMCDAPLFNRLMNRLGLEKAVIYVNDALRELYPSVFENAFKLPNSDKGCDWFYSKSGTIHEWKTPMLQRMCTNFDRVKEVKNLLSTA